MWFLGQFCEYLNAASIVSLVNMCDQPGIMRFRAHDFTVIYSRPPQRYFVLMLTKSIIVVYLIVSQSTIVRLYSYYIYVDR
jgi:hypothetical protein